MRIIVVYGKFQQGMSHATDAIRPLAPHTLGGCLAVIKGSHVQCHGTDMVEGR